MKNNIALNSKSCEDEQLQFSGAIQPFGALIAFQKCSRIITHVSENIHLLTNHDISYWLSKPVQSTSLNHLPITEFEKQNNQFRANFFGIEIDPEKRIDITVTVNQSHVILELMPASKSLVKSISDTDLLHTPTTESELERHYQELVRSIHQLIKYDRVMLYQFDDDWEGVVIAEITNEIEGIGSYLGLRFPSGDIPKIARDLYLINPFRSIPDSQATSVILTSTNNQPIDLSLSDLRSVSPMHKQYLHNMGVIASFSLPIVINDKLWGIIACHHLTRNQIPITTMQECVKLCKNFSIGLSCYISGVRMNYLDKIKREMKNIFDSMSSDDLPNSISACQFHLLDLFQAVGFAIIKNDDLVSIGETPDLEDIITIDKKLNELDDFQIFTSVNIHQLLPQFMLKKINVCGVMAIGINLTNRYSIRFYWFRPPITVETAWGGNPNKPLYENKYVTDLSPRHSFERWVEIKSDESRKWSAKDQTTAATFRRFAITYFNNRL